MSAYFHEDYENESDSDHVVSPRTSPLNEEEAQLLREVQEDDETGELYYDGSEEEDSDSDDDLYGDSDDDAAASDASGDYEGDTDVTSEDEDDEQNEEEAVLNARAAGLSDIVEETDYDEQQLQQEEDARTHVTGSSEEGLAAVLAGRNGRWRRWLQLPDPLPIHWMFPGPLVFPRDDDDSASASL